MELNQGGSFLSEDQEALLDLLLAEEGLESEPLLQITPSLDTAPVLLTYAQSRIWFLEQMEPGSTAFLIPTAVRLNVPINAALLTEAFHALWHRHTILDAAIYEEDGRIWQRAGNFALPPLPVIELTHLDGVERETAVFDLIAKDAATPFAPTGTPLIRAAIARLQDDKYVLLLTVHHIIADGWSVNLLLRELVQIYLYKFADQPISLPELPGEDWELFSGTPVNFF